MPRKAIIIGAGPAGLTAAYELLKRTDVIPVVLEKSGYIGGISRTTTYKGNRMDMGPHRFFSKSDRVMDWWLSIMPLERGNGAAETISYQNKSREINTNGRNSNDSDKVMLLIRRLTRIYFLRKFFAYPIQLSLDTLRTLGLVRTIKIMLSFLYARLLPRKPENSLEDFIVNKFGKQLYLLFFKDYTEKVWGIAPNQISAKWGAQRIKGVSLSKAIGEAIRGMRNRKKADIGQKGVETSLIEQFLYPKYGPGSLWQEIARQVEERGGKVYLHQEVQKITTSEGKLQSVVTVNSQSGKTAVWAGDFFFSTMPVQELIAGMGEGVPAEVRQVAAGLLYRDFINVGILLKQLSTKKGEKLELKDNWIYIQERDVKVGRLMIYNNWGGGMIKDPNTTWIGMEYFCNKTDAVWNQSDEEIERLAVDELVKMDLARVEDVLDSTVQRMEKTYPAYFGTYDKFDVIQNYTDQIENLFLIGRNGMHKYNNSDHSSLCAMVAVDNIVAGVASKANLWAINTEQEYHEEKTVENIAPQNEMKRKPAIPFLEDYLWKNRTNRGWWIGGIVVFLLQFIIFKFKYPYANYMPDSYSYLEAAATNADVNMWPVAYSKFLRLISVFTHSDKVVVGLQYVFLQASSLFFLFSLLYFQNVGRWLKGILLIFVIVNPVTLYIANYISADALFIGFSLLWLSALVWIVYRPMAWMVVAHGILLLGCFTLRYNAIYYPLISLGVFIVTRRSWKFKIWGFTVGAGLVLASFLFTSQKMGVITGKKQFSAFGGWQLANNALYMYEQIPGKEWTPVPARFSSLEAMVREHLDTLSKVKRSHEDSVNAFFYLWSPKAPLVSYLIREYKKDSTTPYFKRWASEAPLYADYAYYLIRKYPMEYAKSWMLPNAVKFAVPPTEFLGTYNMGADSVGKLAKDWFNYKSQKVKDHNKKDDRIAVTEWYPVFVALVNLMFIIGLIGMVVLGAIRKKEYGLPQLLGIALLLWLLNCSFSIFASPIVLRYQTFPMLVFLPLGALMIERIWKMT